MKTVVLRFLAYMGMPLVLILFSVDGAWGQRVDRAFAPNPLVINGRACSTCKVVAERYSRIGEADPPSAISDRPRGPELDGRGRLVVIGFDGLPQIWSLAGEYQRTIGRTGEGPGEFSGLPSFRVGPGDSLWFFHGVRVSVFSPDFMHVRSFRSEMEPGVPLLVGDGRIVFQGAAMSRDLAGFQLHIMNDIGVLLSSFALVPQVPVTVPAPHLVPFQMASARGEFWTLDGIIYGLHKWRLDGSLVQSYRRDAPWFTTRFNSPDPRRPISWAGRAREDSLGRIWTMTRDASESWEQFLPGASTTGGGEGSIAALQYDKLYDTVIEVLDVVSLRVLAEVRLPGYPLGFLGDSYVATFEVSTDDIPQIQIWRVALQ